MNEILAELGPDGSIEAVQNRMGQEGTPVCYDTVRKAKKAMYETREPVVAARIEQEMAAEPDRLQTFIRFAVAVEMVGGVERARELLTHFDKIREILGNGQVP